MSMDQLEKKKVLYWEEHSNLILLRGYSWYKIEIKRTASAACSVHHSLLWCFHAWWWLFTGNWSNHATQGTQALPSNQSGNLNQLVLDCSCCLVTQMCPTLCDSMCDSMGCCRPGFPVLHYLLEFVQTHVHWVNDAIQPSHPLSPSSSALNLSQHQVFSCSSHQGAKVLELQLQHWSFQWIFRVDFL